ASFPHAGTVAPDDRRPYGDRRRDRRTRCRCRPPGDARASEPCHPGVRPRLATSARRLNTALTPAALGRLPSTVSPPDIVHNLADPAAPNSVVGLLIAASAARHATNAGPLTIICCDNLPHNGEVVRGRCKRSARRGIQGALRWARRSRRTGGSTD